MFQASYTSFIHHLRWVMRASKWSKKVPMMTMSLSLKGRGRWAQVLNTHVVVAAPILQPHLVTPQVKVTVHALSHSDLRTNPNA
jgi:hypothetical protein